MSTTLNIAVNTRFLLPDKLEGLGYYSHEILSRMVALRPEYTFHFLFDRPYNERFCYGPNVVPHVLLPQARHPALWHIWFQWSVRYWLKRNKPNAFFSPDGFLSVKANTPTLLTLHDLAFQAVPETVPPMVRKYYHHFVPRFLRRADAIAAISPFTKKHALETYALEAKKIYTIPNGISPIYAPQPKDVQEKTRQRHANGKPFFLCLGSLNPRKNLVRTLQAFSIYAEQDPTAQLVITGAEGWQQDSFHQTLNQLSCKNRIHLTGYLDQLEVRNLLASATALIYPSLWEGFGLPVAESIACGTPVVTSKNSPMAEIATQHAILVEPTDTQALANAMQNVHELKVSKQAILALRTKYDWDTAALKTVTLLESII